MISTTRRHGAPAAAHPFDILAIVFVSLLLATSAVAFAYYSKWRKADAEWTRVTVTPQERSSFKNDQETVKDIQNALEGLESDLLKLSHLVGYYSGDEAKTNLAPLADVLNDAKEKFQLPAAKVDHRSVGKISNPVTLRNVVEALEHKIHSLFEDQQTGIKKLEKERDDLVGARRAEKTGDVAKKREERQAEERRLQGELDTAIKAVEEARLARDKERDNKLRERTAILETVASLRRDKIAVERRLFRTKEDNKEKKEKLEETLRNILEGIRSLDRIIVEITDRGKKKDTQQEDGRVLSSATNMDVAWIDLGRRDRVVKRMEFDVFRRLKGGKEDKRGRVVVIAVEDNRSKVRILKRWLFNREFDMAKKDKFSDRELRELQMDPLGDGDLVRNEVFEKDKKRYFVFAGKFTNELYKNEAAKRLIEELGDEVDREVSERTSYVVLGKGYEEDPNFKKAEEIAIPKMSEKALLELLGKY